MIRKLAHLNFVTNDLPRIVDFYVDKLGLKVRFTLNNQRDEPFGYYFECGDSTFLEFFDQKMAAEVWGGDAGELTPGTRYKHFCFEVTGLDEYCRQLKEKVFPSPILRWAWTTPVRHGSPTRMATRSS